MKKKKVVAYGLMISLAAMAVAGCSGGTSSSDAPATTAAAAAPETKAAQGGEAEGEAQSDAPGGGKCRQL